MWLWDWRAAVGLVAGFLIGMLIFGAPWHLQGAWGDVPTWLLVVVGAAAAWAGLSQLRTIRQQMGDEVRRNVKRDELLDKQLAEAEARALSERRRQAEAVDVSLVANGRPLQFKGRVVNSSPRPITDITCKIMSRTTLETLAVPDASGQMFVAGGPGDTEFIPSTVPVILYDTLRPETRCGFIFNKVSTVEPDHILVAWFTDDAGFRWQLDEYLHLVPARDGDDYVP